MMRGRRFFKRRYRQLGWQYRDACPRQAIRTNTTSKSSATVLQRLRSKGVKLRKIPFLRDGYWIDESPFSVGATPEYLLGYYSIQEAAAQIPATLFTQLDEKLVLDACAAPGGKTIQLADLMRNTGTVVALDMNRRRLTALENHLERCHIRNTIVYNMDARQASRIGKRFDRILLDVPCSGNFATDPKWFQNRTLQDVHNNALVQRQILAEASRILNRNSELVYSTCSLEPEENEVNIDWAIKTLNLQVEKINCLGEKAATEVFGRQLNSTIEHCRRIWPGETQGFFVAKLRLRGEKD